MAIFNNADDETQALVMVISAAVALHALICGKDNTLANTTETLVNEAFEISREFWKQAKQKVGP